MSDVKSAMGTKTALPPDQIMCPCSGTTLGNIQILFQQGLDMDAISRRTGAISGCGGCEWDIAECLKKFSAQTDNDTKEP